MLRRYGLKRNIGFFLFDWVGTLLMLALAAILRIRIGYLPVSFDNFLNRLHIPVIRWWEGLSPGDIVVLPAFILVLVIWPFFLIIFSVYDGRRNKTFKDEFVNVFFAITASTLVLAGVLFLTYRETSRGVFVLFYILDLSLLLGARFIWYLYYQTSTANINGNTSNVLIIDTGVLGQRVAAEFLSSNRRDINIVGFIDDNELLRNRKVDGIPVLGAYSQIPEIARDKNISDAVIALPSSARESLIDLCKKLQNQSIHIHVIPDFFDFMFPDARYENFGGLPIIDLGDPYFIENWQPVKRFFDLVTSLLCILLFSPVFLLISLLIRLDSSGSVFYTQTRIGYGGKSFKMFKFRTMCKDAEKILNEIVQEDNSLSEEWDEFQKLTNDPRITRVGKVLRKLSIDEIPQLFNVARGEMSLIGPRPFLPSQIDLYGSEAYKNYIRVRPGITGMWQVSGRNKASFTARAEWDNYYIQNWSIILDIKILLRTFTIVLLQEGAY